MLMLAREVYGHKQTLTHLAEPLAYSSQHDIATSEGVSANAIARGWHPVSAIEMGMAPADFGEQGLLRYSFVNGHYQATGLIPKNEANALVLTGVVHDVITNTDKKTLAVSFRGTDEVGDFT